jgi:hypothetical protein
LGAFPDPFFFADKSIPYSIPNTKKGRAFPPGPGVNPG